jgi:hypothetical protein
MRIPLSRYIEDRQFEMLDSTKMNSKTVRLELLQHLLQYPTLANFKLIGNERIVDAGASEFVPSIELVTTSVPEGQAVDAHLAIYWRRFSSVAQHVIAGKPPETVSVRPWEIACIVLNFGKLSGDAETWANMRVSSPADIARFAAEIANAYEAYGEAFLKRCATAEGLLAYLDQHPDAPGTWRMMLEFLLRERVQGTSAACAALRAIGPRTEWERRQQMWLSEHLCPQDDSLNE